MNKLKIWNTILFFSLCIASFGQVPVKKPQLYSYQDIQNSRYIGRSFSKLWIVRGSLVNNVWNERPEYYELDKEGRIVLKIFGKLSDGQPFTDTAVFTYDDLGNLTASIAYSNNGELKTRSTILKYEFW